MSWIPNSSGEAHILCIGLHWYTTEDWKTRSFHYILHDIASDIYFLPPRERYHGEVFMFGSMEQNLFPIQVAPISHHVGLTYVVQGLRRFSAFAQYSLTALNNYLSPKMNQLAQRF